jgi:hypothetical protein
VKTTALNVLQATTVSKTERSWTVLLATTVQRERLSPLSATRPLGNPTSTLMRRPTARTAQLGHSVTTLEFQNKTTSCALLATTVQRER